MSETTPTTIGPYQIIREIGKGGMSFVYRALDTRNDKQVALKVLPTRHADDPAYIQRFVREGQHAASLIHPNIVRIFEAGEYDEYHTIAMELIEGGSLTEYLRGQWDLLPSQIPINILRQVASGLDYAHSQGYLHRDIKPSNILLSGDLHDPATRVLISDFGVARRMSHEGTAVTQSGFTVGTPNFMSPEQARGEEQIDHRSDIYSLGAVAYVLFTGKMPFKADTQLALMHKVVYEPPTPPEQLNPQMPQGVAYTLKQALAKDPNQRFNSGLELAIALDNGLNWVPSTSDMRAIDATAFPAVQTSQMELATVRGGWTFMPTLVTALLALIAILFMLLLPVGQPVRQWLGIEPEQALPSQPIVLSSYQDPNGEFELDVPDAWSRTIAGNVTTFEPADFIGRLFVEKIDSAMTTVGSDQRALQSVLDSYVRQPNLPFKNLRPLQNTAPQIVRENAAEALYSGQWLGVDVVLRLVATAELGMQNAYVIGSAIDVTEEKNFGHLTEAVLGSFFLQEAAFSNNEVAANSDGSEQPGGSPEATAAQPTVKPTSTPLPPTELPTVTPFSNNSSLDASAEPLATQVVPQEQSLTANQSESSGLERATSSDDKIEADTIDAGTPTRVKGDGSSVMAATYSPTQQTATAEALQVVVNQKLTTIASAIPTEETPTANVIMPAEAIAESTAGATSVSTTADEANEGGLINTESNQEDGRSNDRMQIAQQATSTPTRLATKTLQPTNTATEAATMAATRSIVVAATESTTQPATQTSVSTATSGPTATSEPTETQEPTATKTETPRPTATAEPTASGTPTSIATATTTATAIPATVTPTTTRTPRPTQTSSPTSTATTAATSTATSTATATATKAATSTATFTHTPVPTETPTLTRTPLPTRTSLPTRTATSTRSATDTPTRTPTPEDTPVSTITSTATVSFVPANASVTLVQPLEPVLQGRHEFSWQSNITLRPGQLFELIFWEAGRDPIVNGFGPVGAKTETVISMDLDKVANFLPQFVSGRDYEWGVLLVTESPYRRLRYLGGGHKFRFEQNNGGGSKPAPTPRPRG